MKVIILGAGYGTRLYPLTKSIPKPLIQIAGIPIINRILNSVLSINNFSEIFIITNNKFYSHFSRWLTDYEPSLKSHCPIRIINDDTSTNESRLGPIGDLHYIFDRHAMDEDLIILAGDNLFERDIQEIIDERKNKNASILCVHQFETVDQVANKYGVVTADADGRVLEFQEKPKHPQSTLAATAVYLIRKEDLFVLHKLFTMQAANELNAGEIVIEFLREHVPVFCSNIPLWFDIGSLDDLELANSYYHSK